MKGKRTLGAELLFEIRTIYDSIARTLDCTKEDRKDKRVPIERNSAPNTQTETGTKRANSSLETGDETHKKKE